MIKTIKSIVKLYIIYYDNMDFEGCNSSVHIDIIFCDICCNKFFFRAGVLTHESGTGGCLSGIRAGCASFQANLSSRL